MPRFCRTLLMLGAVGLTAPHLPAQAPAAAPAPQGPNREPLIEFTLAKVADGVYVTVFPDPQGAGINGNGVVIINDTDVLVVDTQDTPAAASAVIREIRKLTSKPVRYVVNTHWHGDHYFGNQAYRAAYPGVEFIGHPATREDITAEMIPLLAGLMKTGLPDAIGGLQSRLASGKSSAGLPLTDAQRSSLRGSITSYQWLLKELGTVQQLPPTLTVADSLTLYRGDRTIEIRFLGRGNTRGDLVVYLPKERILATGDLLVYPTPYGSESFPSEWVAVLQKLRELPADQIIPGHGVVQHDHEYLDLVKALLESTIAQVKTAVANGLDSAATQKAVNLDSLRTRFTHGDPNLARLFDDNYTSIEIHRAWREARGELKAARPQPPD